MQSQKEFLEEIESLSVEQKDKVYWHYFATQLELKHHFEIVTKSEGKGWGEPYKEFTYTKLHKLNIPYTKMTFEDFTSTDNIKTEDMGEDWAKHGRAARFRTEYTGIYYWYPRFKEEIFKQRD